MGVGLLFVGALLDETPRLIVWSVALALDLLGPYLMGAEGWKLTPRHFAERHGLIVIIALGESIVAIGLGAQNNIGVGIVTAATLGMLAAAAIWWVYFDVLAHVAERRISQAEAGRERNEMARDAYSYLHFPMVFGIALFALGLKKTIAHTDHELVTVTAFALCGGAALYLLGLVSFGTRTTSRTAWDTVICAVLLLAFVPVATHLSALTSLAFVAAALTLLVTYKVLRFGEGRDRVRGRINSPEQFS